VDALGCAWTGQLALLLLRQRVRPCGDTAADVVRMLTWPCVLLLLLLLQVLHVLLHRVCCML
jgi:hypothetical protein